MIFPLHHSTGALMLDTADRNEVISWSERQLGSQAGLVSVLQDGQPSLDSVEKSGTGIAPTRTEGREARLSFMVDSVQRLAGPDREITQSFEWYRAADLSSRKSSAH
jgi:hypothetical protein